MGLDMYLEERIYIGAHFSHRKVDTSKMELIIEDKPVDLDWNNLDSVCMHVGYWRKANAIHGWFVDNIQGGVDNCQRSQVTQEQLAELYTHCKHLIDNPEDTEYAAKHLPPVEGFFFGGTNIDEGYMQDMESTVNILEPLVAGMLADEITNTHSDSDFFYEASW